MTTRRILYGLAGMVALFVVSWIIGGVWDNNGTVGNNIATTLWAIGIIGFVLLLLVLAVVTVRRRRAV